MKKWTISFLMLVLLVCNAHAEEINVYSLYDEAGVFLTQTCYEPSKGDQYISASNQMYEIANIDGSKIIAHHIGDAALPSTEWLQDAVQVSSKTKSIGLYCTHSDESYEPSDGFYSTRARGTIYEVANVLAEEMKHKGIDAIVAEQLHHPHDAGAYRRSRQTAIDLIRTIYPDCLIDVHRDGIPDPAAYETNIGGRACSKIRLLVGRGNQNAELNKDFAMLIKAVADKVYPGLIKDIYLGKGAFNQDLLPHSILLECGTYMISKEKVIASMPMIADVINRSLYGGVLGSAGKVNTDLNSTTNPNGGITMGEADPASDSGVRYAQGSGFLGILLFIGIAGLAILSAGNYQRAKQKASRNLSEMTGGIMGRPPRKNEDHEHS